jgi:hypothetical protein
MFPEKQFDLYLKKKLKRGQKEKDINRLANRVKL